MFHVVCHIYIIWLYIYIFLDILMFSNICFMNKRGDDIRQLPKNITNISIYIKAYQSSSTKCNF